MNKKVVEKIIENTPFAIILVGLFLFLLGAAGSWPTPSIQITDRSGRIALMVMGAVSFIVGAGLLRREKSDVGRKPKLDKDYGIKITAPHEGADAGPTLEIHGEYQERPPDNLFRVLEFSPNSHHVWPKGALCLTLNRRLGQCR